MKYTEKTAAAVLGKLLRSTQKEPREFLRYAWIDEAGRQCCADGFRAYRLNKPVANLPVIPARLKPLDLGRIYPDAKERREIPLPCLEDVKAVCAADRANKDEPRRYQFPLGDGLPVLDPRFLRDMLQLFPDARCYVCGQFSPVLFVSEHGDGLIMPMRTTNTSPRQIPGKAAPRLPVFSAAQFAARFAA